MAPSGSTTDLITSVDRWIDRLGERARASSAAAPPPDPLQFHAGYFHEVRARAMASKARRSECPAKRVLLPRHRCER